MFLLNKNFFSRFADVTVKEEVPNQDFISNVVLSGKAGRLSLECQQPDYSFPCVVGQKWYCVLKDNRLVIRNFS